MKYTKGNWKQVGAFVISETDADICSTSNVNNLPVEEQIANANLIAAAPDLLDACKDALEIVAGERITYDAFPPKDHLTKILEKIVRRCEEKLEAAIKKAK